MARVLAVLAALVLLVGCGGGAGSEAKDAVVSTTTEPTAASTATTDVPDRTPEEIAALAQAATLHPEDFGDGWKVSGSSDEIVSRGPDDECLSDAGAGYDERPEGSVAGSPTVQFDDEPHYVTAEATVFETVEDAKSLMTWLNGEAWADCTEAFLQAFQDDADPSSGNDVEVESRSTGGLGQDGFEAYARLLTRDGEGEPIGYVRYQWYRAGNVVLRVAVETGRVTDADAIQASYDDVQGAIDAAFARLHDEGLDPD